MVNESACNARDLDLIPGSGDPPEKGMAIHSNIPAWRSLLGYSWGGRKESDTTEQLTPVCIYKVRFLKNLFFQDKKVRERVREKSCVPTLCQEGWKFRTPSGQVKAGLGTCHWVPSAAVPPLLFCRHRPWKQNALLQKSEEQHRSSRQPEDRNSLHSTGKRETEAGRR